jgi:hypothetical protein
VIHIYEVERGYVLRYLVLLLFLLLGCGEDKPAKVYDTSCPSVELEHHIGYLSIEGVDDNSYVYWGCVGGDCTSEGTSGYAVSVRSMGGDVLRVSCGFFGNRVDRVNVVVIK